MRGGVRDRDHPVRLEDEHAVLRALEVRGLAGLELPRRTLGGTRRTLVLEAHQDAIAVRQAPHPEQAGPALRLVEPWRPQLPLRIDQLDPAGVGAVGGRVGEDVAHRRPGEVLGRAPEDPGGRRVDVFDDEVGDRPVGAPARRAGPSAPRGRPRRARLPGRSPIIVRGAGSAAELAHEPLGARDRRVSEFLAQVLHRGAVRRAGRPRSSRAASRAFTTPSMPASRPSRAISRRT